MGGHDAAERGVEPAVRRGVVGQDGFEAAVVDGDVGVGVGLDEAVAREMLAAVGDTGLQQAVHQAFSQQRHHTRVAAESAVADDAAFTVIQVEHGGEAEINARGAQLCAQHITTGGGSVGGSELVFHPQRAQLAHGRQVGETVGPEALHAAAFMVDADQQVFADVLDFKA